MSTGGGGGRAPLSEINVTPLVDVMLVLLIIFMVAAPMMTTGVEVDLPRANANRMPLEEEKLLLLIDAQQRVYLRVVGGEGGENEVPIASLQETLLANRRLQESRELYVQADESVPYGFVVRVLAIVRQAGVEQLGLVTDPRGEGDAPAVTP
ncbi:MAG: ExbD/TolR family protein [Sandaracinaceae bacterium]|nr:ExbD/TolR family protein [Sandaracinaceae bacterium]